VLSLSAAGIQFDVDGDRQTKWSSLVKKLSEQKKMKQQPCIYVFLFVIIIIISLIGTVPSITPILNTTKLFSISL